MRKLLLVLALFLSAFAVQAQEKNLKERLTEHVYILAADSLQGREAGTEGSRKAAHYIIGQFEEIGLKPFVGDSTYLQKFGLRSGSRVFMNVIGYIEGSDPVLKNEYIIIGAHYDHLGFKRRGEGDVIYNGADDNASGTAAMIEIARMLKAREGRLARTVLFAAFDAEEIGLYGSAHMASLLPAEQVRFMISMDMVGWYKADRKLSIAGVAMLKDGRNIMENIPKPAGLNVELKKYDKMIMGGSDHDSFAERGIPAFYATTGLKSPYHKPEDTAEKIDYDGMVLVTEYLGAMASEFASGGSDMAASGKVSPKHRMPVVEFAITGSVGSSKHRYTEGALTGKTAFSWNAGAFVQFNMGYFAIRSEVLYRQSTARFPYEDNALGSSYRKFSTQSVTVPVNLLLRFPKNSPVYFYAGAGGYYSYNFRGKLGGEKIDFDDFAYRHQWGWTATVGAAFGSIGIAFTSYNGISKVLRSGPDIKSISNYFTLYYRF